MQRLYRHGCFLERKNYPLTEEWAVLLGRGATWRGGCVVPFVLLGLLKTVRWRCFYISAVVITAAVLWAGNFRQVFPSWRQSLCTAFLVVAQILSNYKKNASCSLPWEGQVEYDPKILPPPCFTIKVKIWSGDAAAKLLISTLMTTSAFLRFHFDLHGPAQSAVKLQFSWVKCLLAFQKMERRDLTELGLYH